jgi:hypothetical protein
VNVRAPGWLPDRDRREDLGEGICCSGPCFMRSGVNVGKYLYVGGLERDDG